MKRIPLVFILQVTRLQDLEAKIRRFSSTTTKELSDVEDGKDVSVCGIITEIRTTLTKKGDKMAYVRIEDLMGGGVNCVS